MQKFILIRGHQGSGKSTYAAKLIAEFQQTYPNAKVVHIENDKELTDENGVYWLHSLKTWYNVENFDMVFHKNHKFHNRQLIKELQSYT